MDELLVDSGGGDGDELVEESSNSRIACENVALDVQFHPAMDILAASLVSGLFLSFFFSFSFCCKKKKP